MASAFPRRASHRLTRAAMAYNRWFRKVRVRDTQARARILGRIRRLSIGNPGDARPVGEGDSELRINYGPGYRVYYVQLRRPQLLATYLMSSESGVLR